MKTTTKTLLIAIFVTFASYLAWSQTNNDPSNTPRILISSYQTSSTRTSSVTNICPPNLNRASLYSQSDIDSSNQYMNSVTSSINIDG